MAISPQKTRYSARIVADHDLSFDVLSDRGNELSRRLGLVFDVSDEVRDVYLELGVDLERFNGDDSWTLPMPARYVVDAEGVIRAADVHPDYTQRPEPGASVEALKNL